MWVDSFQSAWLIYQQNPVIEWCWWSAALKIKKNSEKKSIWQHQRPHSFGKDQERKKVAHCSIKWSGSWKRDHIGKKIDPHQHPTDKGTKTIAVE